MPQSRSTRTSTHNNTLASMSSASNSQKRNKRKEPEDGQPDVVDKTANKKTKTRESLDDAFLIPNTEEKAPWENFEPFSASKMSWMLQELFCEAKENRRMMNQMQLEMQNHSLLEKGENKGAELLQHLRTSSAKASKISSVEGPLTYPLETMESLNEFEAELDANAKVGPHLISLLLRLAQPDASQFVFNILYFLLKAELAVEFTYYGKKPLRSFKSLALCELVKKTVQKKFPHTEESFFANRISAWLSSCKKKQSRQMKQQNKTL